MVISKETYLSKKKVTKFQSSFTLPHQVGALDNMLQTIKTKSN